MCETLPGQVEVACVSHFLEARLLDKGYRAIRLEELEEGGWLRPKLGQVVPVPKDKKDDTRYMVDGGIVTSRHELIPATALEPGQDPPVWKLLVWCGRHPGSCSCCYCSQTFPYLSMTEHLPYPVLPHHCLSTTTTAHSLEAAVNLYSAKTHVICDDKTYNMFTC